MTMEVQIISTETITPSTPTPRHLRSFHLSSLDLLAPQMYVPLIFFYDGNPLKTAKKIIQLKNSLSQTLTRFYPLAGRIKEEEQVDCNDEGVDFLVAQVNGQLSEFLPSPKSEVLTKLVPWNYYRERSDNDVLLAVQINVFDCGGMAIGVCIAHTMADATTLATLVNTWATTARGSSELISPSFPLTSLFPQKELSGLIRVKALKDTVATKSFMFDGSKIEMLRARDPKVESVGYPTRVESVTTLLWRCAMRAQVEAETNRPSVAVHAVNLRGRMDPPLTDYSSGNIFVFASVVNEGPKHTQRSLEVRLREAIRKIDGDYIKKLQGSDEHAWDNLNSIGDAYIKGEVVVYNFTSWCRFPFYDVDFGWGKPVWVSGAGFPKNCFIVMGTRSGEGLEVWANMAEEDMAKFEKDEELLTFASPHAI